jgi:hypothetical protein
MIDYLLHWMHAYIVHFGIWMTMLVGFDIYKNGLPAPEKIKGIFKSALILAVIISVFSSHAQTHIIKHFLLK